MTDLKDLTPEYRSALMEALEKDVVEVTRDDFGTFGALRVLKLVNVEVGKKKAMANLTPAGRFLALALKESEEQRANFLSEYKAHCSTRREHREKDASVRQATAVSIALQGHRECQKQLIETGSQTLGEEVRRLRLDLDVTQSELGEQLGVTGNTVAKWERDEMGMGGESEMLFRQLQEDSSTFELRRIRVQLKEAKRVLSMVQWNSFNLDWKSMCPCCRCTEEVGHSDGCCLAEVIK